MLLTIVHIVNYSYNKIKSPNNHEVKKRLSKIFIEDSKKGSMCLLIYNKISKNLLSLLLTTWTGVSEGKNETLHT